MTTNQTIDGVPRELIQWLVDHEDLLDFGGREHELRALLDAPAQPFEATDKRLREALEGMVEYFPEGHSDGECFSLERAREVLALPATQHQSEPVARIEGLYGDPEAFAEREIRALCDVNKLKIGTLLYAVQPAPVAVVLPERLQQVLKFLEGAENLDGHWFGETGPTGQIYWWRNELRKALAETNLFANQQ